MIEEALILKPGRPKDAAKREEIIAAATSLFLDKGYELTSMDAVARLAGVSKLTIYSHFADKNELFRAIIQHRCDSVGMPTEFESEAKLSPEQAFLKIAQHVVAIIFRADSVRLLRVVQAEALHHPEVVQAYYEVGPRRVRTAFIELLARYNAKGLLAIKDTARAAEQFFSLLKGERLQRAVLMISPPPTSEELDQHIRETINFFLAAYRPDNRLTKIAETDAP